MQDQLLYEYAVIRLVPQVEREEFLNVGVVLYCAARKFLKAIYLVDHNRISTFACKTDIEEVTTYLNAFEQICAGNKMGGKIALLPPADRFRWLTATRSTIVQTSRVHPGFCTDPATKLYTLYDQLVSTIK